MAVLETEALILRTYNFGEADKIVVALTRNAGVVRSVAKGCRKLKSRFGASLEPFTLAKLTFYHKENQELASLRQSEIIKSNFDLSSDADTLTGLAYMGDLVIEFSPPYQANEKLFRMVTACLDAIGQSQSDLQSILRYFEIWILRLEGFLPDLRRCGECQSEFNEGNLPLLGNDLTLRCRDCSRGTGTALSERLQNQLRATQKLAPFPFAEQSRASERVLREMADLAHRLIGRALERQPRLKPTFR